MEDSHVRTVFCDYFSETVQFYSYQVHVRIAWPSGRTVFAITRFCIRTEHWTILKCWTASGRLAKTFQTVSTTEIQLSVEIGKAWPSVQTVLLWCPDVFNAEASRHCKATGRLQRSIWTVAQEPVVLTWKLHRIFMDIFLETCNHTHGMKWDTVHITWRLWIESIILLKSNHYIKCFCQPECCQYKILTNSPFGHSGTKKHLTSLKIHSKSKTKNTPHFCLKRTKGKQSIRENHNY